MTAGSLMEQGGLTDQPTAITIYTDLDQVWTRNSSYHEKLVLSEFSNKK